MCFGGGPSTPAPPPPPQEAKQADTVQATRNARAARQADNGGMGFGTSTMLTGANGVPNSQLNVQKPSLLGQ